MNTSSYIYKKIKHNILSQKYPAGFHLKEVWLSEMFKTTRTPLRESLLKLEQEGLVKVIPNKGTFVIGLSIKEIEDLFEVREALEIKAGLLAIERSSKEQLLKIKKELEKRELLFKRKTIKDYRVPQKDFHFDMLKLTKNSTLISIWKNLNSKLSLIRITSAMRKERFLKSINDHKGILHNIYNRNYEKTAELIKAHNQDAKENLLLHFKKKSN